MTGPGGVGEAGAVDEGGGVLLVGTALATLGGVDPSHRAVLVRDGLITWTGSDPHAAPGRPEVVDLGTAWLTPGFVDAHVHATATGLAASGVALAGARSAAEVCERVAAHARHHPGAVVHGTGWEDLDYPEGRPPTADELAAAAPGRTVVLTRVDGHSCLVDRGTLERLDLRGVDDAHVHRGDDGRPSGWLLETASGVAHAARDAALSDAELAAARDAACERAAALGITAIHEMGIPALGSRDDAVTWATGDWPIDVQVWWADPEPDPEGLLRPGGDLFLDGSIGSCTAACTQPYDVGDGTRTGGELFLDDDAVTALFTAATLAGRGAGVHAIGDRAIAQAVRALRATAATCGVDAVRRARHRIEHAELPARDDVAAMADLGVVASVQPAFDATWNGPDGLYERRFGRAAADRSNPFAWFAEAGVAMCFSSDSTVTPLDPWGGVRAAESHLGGLGVDRATALHSATIGGHHAAGLDHLVGALRPGMRADVVAWPGDPLGGRPGDDEDPAGWAPIAVVAGGRRLV